MKYTHILWDFNGTIFNDVDASRRATNILLRRYSLPEILSVDELRGRFGFPVRDYYAGLGFDFERHSYEDMAQDWAVLHEAECRDCEPCPGAVDNITKLNDKGYIQAVISACEHKMLQSRIAALGLDGMFENIYGTCDVNAHSKNDTALTWRRENAGASAIMIGDTPHDLEVARLMGADCLLYSGGYVSRQRLAALGCPVIDMLDQIWDYL